MEPLLTFLFLVLSSLFLVPRPVFAKFNIGDVFGQGTLVTGNFTNNVSNLAMFINPIVFSFYTIAGLSILGVLIYAGYMYIMGAGKADKKQIQQGHDAMIWGLVGLAVVISSFWIIRIVEIMTGVCIISGDVSLTPQTPPRPCS